ncbi:MAG: GAF domain-containing protein [Moritella dasanensis]|jgi:GAF domain-containing protein
MPFDNITQSFAEWQKRLNTLADHSGLHSILIMESKHDTMEVVVANEQPIYNVGDCGPKSRQPGCHELYCERVVDTAQPVFIPDASIDDEWKDNEDYVKFNLGVYLGFPLVNQGVVVGTICALNDKTFDFNEGEPSMCSELVQLKNDIELAFS